MCPSFFVINKQEKLNKLNIDLNSNIHQGDRRDCNTSYLKYLQYLKVSSLDILIHSKFEVNYVLIHFWRIKLIWRSTLKIINGHGMHSIVFLKIIMMQILTLFTIQTVSI